MSVEPVAWLDLAEHDVVLVGHPLFRDGHVRRQVIAVDARVQRVTGLTIADVPWGVGEQVPTPLPPGLLTPPRTRTTSLLNCTRAWCTQGAGGVPMPCRLYTQAHGP